MPDSTGLVAYDTQMFPNLLDQDPEAVRERFARRFAAAEDIDDLFGVLQGSTSKDMVGRALTINSVAWAPFESDRGVIPLAVCDAVDIHTDEVVEFATTSEALVLFIRKAELIGAMPFSVRVVAKKTRSGNTALNFERP
jgi:hypothetical protein